MSGNISPHFPHTNSTNHPDEKRHQDKDTKNVVMGCGLRRETIMEFGGKMMKATGIVRRIDDLGRIVIPKEIRRTLHIRESDPLEIYTDREGQVILKKYSPIGEMTTFARQYAESLAQVSGHPTLIADRDQFIAVSGGCRQLLNKAVSRQLEEKINNRETVIAAKGDRNYINIAEDITVDYAWQLITPIICEGDIIGSVILLENDGKNKMGEVEQKLAQSAAGFLGRQMEQ